jgi:hypothetical protein
MVIMVIMAGEHTRGPFSSDILEINGWSCNCILLAKSCTGLVLVIETFIITTFVYQTW